MKKVECKENRVVMTWALLYGDMVSVGSFFKWGSSAPTDTADLFSVVCALSLVTTGRFLPLSGKTIDNLKNS